MFSREWSTRSQSRAEWYLFLMWRFHLWGFGAMCTTQVTKFHGSLIVCYLLMQLRQSAYLDHHSLLSARITLPKSEWYSIKYLLPSTYAEFHADHEKGPPFWDLGLLKHVKLHMKFGPEGIFGPKTKFREMAQASLLPKAPNTKTNAIFVISGSSLIGKCQNIKTDFSNLA